MARTILFLVSNLVRTGPVAVIKDIAQRLDPREFRPVVVTLSCEGERTCIDDFRANNIEIIQLSLTRFESVTAGPARLREVARESGAEILHSHCFRADVLAAHATLDAWKVSTIHSVLMHDYIPAYGKIVGAWMANSHYRGLRRLDARVSVSETVATAAARYGVTSRVILNGVDTDRYRPATSSEEYAHAREKLQVPTDRLVLLYSGLLIPRKQPVQMITGYRRSIIARATHLVLAGDGPLYDECRHAAGEAENITFLRSRSDVPELLRGADYIISASESEGLSLALLEGCASGLRLICSDIPAHREIKSMFPERVTLFSIQDPDGIVRVLDSLTPESAKANSTPAAVDRISARAMSQAYQKLYRELPCASSRWARHS